MLSDCRERDVAVKSTHISQLHQKEKSGCRILQAGHNWMWRKADQCAEPNQAEQCLKHAAEEDNREEGENNEL
jgi:hypothetical protein